MSVIGFAGMTHLGLCSAVAAADRGWEVVCYDSSASLVEELDKKVMPVSEPDLLDSVKCNESRLEFSSEIGALVECDIVYISADVPTDSFGKSNLKPIEFLISKVASNIKKTTILVVLCQVPPGFTRSLLQTFDGQLFYQVETLVFGQAIDRAVNPERFIIGSRLNDQPLPAKYQKYLESFGCPVLTMSYESAELSKIAINFCLVSSISVANVLAEISESIGADWMDIVPSLRLDKRIGQYSYLKPGLGISGGNLERDLRTIVDISEEKAIDSSIINAWIKNSHQRKDWCWERFKQYALIDNKDPIVAVLGLAYKENTRSIKNSPSLQLLSHMKEFSVRVHDPVVTEDVVPLLSYFESPLECIEGSDVLIISTPWPEYSDISLDSICSKMRGRLIIDPYRMLDGGLLSRSGFQYHSLGRKPLFPSPISNHL